MRQWRRAPLIQEPSLPFPASFVISAPISRGITRKPLFSLFLLCALCNQFQINRQAVGHIPFNFPSKPFIIGLQKLRLAAIDLLQVTRCKRDRISAGSYGRNWVTGPIRRRG